MEMDAWFSKVRFIARTLVLRVILLFYVKATFRSQRYCTLPSREIDSQLILARGAFCISHHIICFESQPKTVTTCKPIVTEYKFIAVIFLILWLQLPLTGQWLTTIYIIVNHTRKTKPTKTYWMAFYFVVGLVWSLSTVT